MKYRGENTLISSKKTNAANIKGLPSEIALKFKTIHVRVYQSETSHDLFFCTIAIPTMSDYEGWILELPVSSYINDEPSPKTMINRYVESAYDPDEDSIVNISELEADVDAYGEPFEMEYSTTSGQIGFSDLVNNMMLRFEEITEQKEKILLLTLRVSGTPYYGKALITSELFNRMVTTD